MNLIICSFFSDFKLFVFFFFFETLLKKKSDLLMSLRIFLIVVFISLICNAQSDDNNTTNPAPTSTPTTFDWTSSEMQLKMLSGSSSNLVVALIANYVGDSNSSSTSNSGILAVITSLPSQGLKTKHF